VVVVGSGTGLAAALAAEENGADGLVLEKAPLIGWTTAVSGGASWIPNSPSVLEHNERIPVEKLVNCVRTVTNGLARDAKIRRFLEWAPEVFEFIEAQTAMEFFHIRRDTDVFPEYEEVNRW
jgi:succinate dehydrogenase/fumarate reductase flavoprotein subunit